MDIGEKTQIWIGRYVATPNPSATPLATPPLKVNIPFTDTLGNVLSPYRFIRMVRSSTNNDGTAGWTECREWSQQAVGATSGGHASFPQNNYQLSNNAFSTQFYNDSTGGTNTVDDSRTINFPNGFDVDEQLVIDFIQTRPFTLTQWTNPTNVSIPDFLRNPFTYGLLYKLQERLYNKGDESMLGRAERTKTMYEKYLREAMGYSHNLLDNKSTPQSFPRVWLPA
jgi:hypothetical protein